jgi:hypothetical protein
LSFVSLLDVETNDFVGPRPVSQIPSGDPKDRRAFYNQNVQNIQLSDLERGRHRSSAGEISSVINFADLSPNWDNKTKTVFIPPGMDCQLFEHPYYRGHSIGWFSNEGEDGSLILPTLHTLSSSGWANLISSIKVKGAFKSSVPDTFQYVRQSIMDAENMMNAME